MSELHDSEEIGGKCLNTLYRLINNCKEEIAMKSELLVQEVVGRMSGDIRRKMDLLTRKEWKKLSVCNFVLSMAMISDAVCCVVKKLI